MPCPHRRTRVYETRKRVGKHWLVRRRRLCLDCGAKFITVEERAVLQYRRESQW